MSFFLGCADSDKFRITKKGSFYSEDVKTIMSTQFSKEMNLNTKFIGNFLSHTLFHSCTGSAFLSEGEYSVRKIPDLLYGSALTHILATGESRPEKMFFYGKYRNPPPWGPAACDPRPKAGTARLCYLGSDFWENR